MNPGLFALEAFFYFSELLIEVNLVLRLLPNPFTVTIMAIDMPAAIRPYSMAVAPDSSRKNFAIKDFIILPLVNGDVTEAA